MHEVEGGAVGSALLVGVMQAIGGPREDPRGEVVPQAEPSFAARLPDLPDGVPTKDLHGQKEPPVDDTGLLDAHDVRVPHAGAHLRLVGEHRRKIAALRELLPDHLEREGPAAARGLVFEREIDGRHPALADEGDDAVVPEFLRSLGGG